MVEQTSDPITRRLRFEPHEIALSSLGFATSLALLIANHRKAVLFEVLGVTVIYATVIALSRSRMNALGRKLCLVSSYAFVIWFYCAVARITPALGSNLRDSTLLHIDEIIFKHTPSVYCEQFSFSWLTGLMSVCYLTYHVHLALAVVHALRIRDASQEKLSAYLFIGFAVGFAGYLLVPAVGPARACPELFDNPIPGGTFSRVIGEVIAWGSSGYDVFPSLHVMITCILLEHDWREVRRRFWIMLGPCIGLFISTIYLRYHYAVDIFAGFLLFLVLRQAIFKTQIVRIGWQQ